MKYELSSQGKNPKDWVKKPIKVLGVATTTEEFNPLYNGGSFKTACEVAHLNGASVWEHPNRAWWVVSFGCPPYALSDKPDTRWTAV